MGNRQPNSDHDLFWCKFGFGECFGASRSNYEHWFSLFKIHFLSHKIIWSRNGSLLLQRVREDDTSKWQFFLFLVSSWGTHLSSFFTFAICCKCQMTVECLMLSSSPASHVVRGSASMIALNWSLSTSDSWPLCSSSSRLLLPLHNFLNHCCTVRSFAVPGQMFRWCCKLSPLIYNPIWIRIRKLLEFAFCLTSFR